MPQYILDHDLEPWLRYDWIPRRSTGCDPKRAMLYQRVQADVDPLTRHLTLLRLLTRALDPDARSAKSGLISSGRLLDLLGVPRHRRGPIGRPPGSQIKGVSREIDVGAREREDQHGIPVLSLWRAQAWPLLTNRFCRDEHDLRRSEREELEAIESAYPDRDGTIAAKKRLGLLQRQKQRWTVAARERIARLR